MDMKDKTSIDYQIGFADSEIISFQSNDNIFFIFLKAWNEVTLRFDFKESIFFVTYTNWDISDVCESKESEHLDKALKLVYRDPPTDHPYKIFQFLDLYENIAAEVICKELVISVLK